MVSDDERLARLVDLVFPPFTFPQAENVDYVETFFEPQVMGHALEHDGETISVKPPYRVRKLGDRPWGTYFIVYGVRDGKFVLDLCRCTELGGGGRVLLEADPILASFVVMVIRALDLALLSRRLGTDGSALS